MAVSVFDAARQVLADKLNAAAGAAFATLDPAAVPPFVLVGLVDAPDPAGGRGIGAWPCQIPVYIAVPPPGDADAAAAMGDRLEVVWRTLGAAPTVAGIYTAPGGTDLPAYTVTYPVDVPNPDC